MMRTRIPFKVAVVASLVVPTPALADDNSTAIVVSATQLMPKSGVHAGAVGPGVELRFVPDAEELTASIGGFAAIGEAGAPRRRDVLDVHFQIGMKPKKAETLAPYIGLGLDVLHITTHEMDRSYRGTTLGLSAQAGVLGKLGDTVVFRATAGYMGAIVPGSGDDLGGLLFEVGLGFVIND